MKNTVKKIICTILTAAMLLALCVCGAKAPVSAQAEGVTYKVGICNFVDDASLNQIVDNITARLAELGDEIGVTFEVDVQNCMTDSAILSQIISNFISDNVDLMVAVATPVAMAMQAATEDNNIPVVFAAVSDPVATGIVESLEAPGANLTGTSDFLDTDAVFNLILAQNPEISKVGLLYDVGQDSSTTAIASAKAYLENAGIEYVEATGTNVGEVTLAAESLASSGVEAVFTPTDNTIMTAELAIYEIFEEAGVLHYAGADSFALNGAFLGYGVNYAVLGQDTADIIADVLVNGANPAVTPVKLPDNGTATINTDICASLGLDYDELAEVFAPYCVSVQPIQTAESFD